MYLLTCWDKFRKFNYHYSAKTSSPTEFVGVNHKNLEILKNHYPTQNAFDSTITITTKPTNLKYPDTRMSIIPLSLTSPGDEDIYYRSYITMNRSVRGVTQMTPTTRLPVQSHQCKIKCNIIRQNTGTFRPKQTFSFRYSL